MMMKTLNKITDFYSKSFKDKKLVSNSVFLQKNNTGLMGFLYDYPLYGWTKKIEKQVP